MLAMARNAIPPERADDVELSVAEIARTAKRGACIILEFTDGLRLWGVPNLLYQKMLGFLRPAPYALNRGS